MTAKPIRVLVADDHMIVRTGIRHVVEGEPDLEVVGEAASGSEALSLASRLRPDVVVLDISMPDQSGLVVAASLRSTTHPPRVLILSMHDNPEYVLESVRAGDRKSTRLNSSHTVISYAVFCLKKKKKKKKTYIVKKKKKKKKKKKENTKQK